MSHWMLKSTSSGLIIVLTLTGARSLWARGGGGHGARGGHMSFVHPAFHQGGGYRHANGHHYYRKNDPAAANHQRAYHAGNSSSERHHHHWRHHHHHHWHPYDWHHHRRAWIYDGEVVHLGGYGRQPDKESPVKQGQCESKAEECERKAREARRQGRPEAYNRLKKEAGAYRTMAKGYKLGDGNLVHDGMRDLRKARE